jgi:Leucine-rich repeat (LRR) protein
MKYIKLYETFKDIDIFDEEDWDEKENDGTFLYWLKQNKNKNGWETIPWLNCNDINLTSLKGIENVKYIVQFDCSNNQLISLDGIEKCIYLKYLDCQFNELTSLKGIEELTNLEYLYCFNNNLTDLNEIENLTILKILNCSNNNFSIEYKRYLINYCKEKNIDLRI